MRTQITVYLHGDSKEWLRGYAARCGLGESEVVRLLVQREAEIKWLLRALTAPDRTKDAFSSLRRLIERSAPYQGRRKSPR
jgi:hypothetical protein